MWIIDGTLKVITFIRGGEVTARIKDVSEGMEAVSEMARNGQKAERTISKLNKGSMTANICNSCMKQLQEYVEG